MSFLTFTETGTSVREKTKIWNVDSSIPLGLVRWEGKFRKYGYFPSHQAVYDAKCLREIADFLEKKTKEHYSFDPNQISMDNIKT